MNTMVHITVSSHTHLIIYSFFDTKSFTCTVLYQCVCVAERLKKVTKVNRKMAALGQLRRRRSGVDGEGSEVVDG